MNITEALRSLDPNDENHWTTDGSPRLDVLKELTGAVVKRQEVVDAAPRFNRQTMDLSAAEDAPSSDEAAVDDAAPSNEPEPTAEDEATPAESIVEGLRDALAHTLGLESGKLPEVADMWPPGTDLTTFDEEALDGDEATLDALIGHCDAVVAEAKELVERLTAAKDRLTEERLRRNPPKSNQEAIRDFINQQHANRVRRLSGGNIDLQRALRDMNKSPLDKAMAANRSRGQNRPNYNPAPAGEE